MARRETPPRSKGAASGSRVDADGLDELSKKDLITRAESLGIDGAAKFTKVELVDELRSAAGAHDRGFLGKARDLLKGVVEKGIAKALGGDVRGRSDGASPRESQREAQRESQREARREPQREAQSTGALHAPPAHLPDDAPASHPSSPVATLTLAEIYLAQGHVARARAIASSLLASNPNDGAAKALLARIERSGVRASASEVAADEKTRASKVRSDGPSDAEAREDQDEDEEDQSLYLVDAIDRDAFFEPSTEQVQPVPAMLDDAPFPLRYNVDECVALAVDPTTLYVYWETRGATVTRARRALGVGAGNGQGGTAVGTLRILAVEALPTGPRVSTRDFVVSDVELGEYFVRELPAGAIVRAAIGLRRGERFLPMAHTLDVEAPPARPSAHFARELVHWSEDETGALGEDEAASFPRTLPVLRRLGRTPLRDAGAGALEEDDDHVAGVGLSSAELAARRYRGRHGVGANPDSEGLHGDGGERLGASDRLARGPSSGSFRAGSS